MLRMTTSILLLFPFLFSPCVAAGQSPEFHREIQSLYGFYPRTLTEIQMAKKSAELDAFWKKVRSNPNKFLPLLRAELQASSNPEFFYYDGSKLLLSLSKAKSDKNIAINAIPRCDLRDIQRTDYLWTVYQLAFEGYDTSEAAFHILKYPDFQAIIPQHALVLGQDYSFIYMLILIKEEFYIEKAISRLEKETDETAQKSLIKLLWYLVTDSADEAIKKAAADTSRPSSVRESANSMVESMDEIGKELTATDIEKLSSSANVSPTASYPDLKTIRQRRMNRISDEALHEFEQITILMRAKKGKR